MLWRLLVILVTVFWLAMTVLLLRVTYFPESSKFARLPPGAVLKMFLDRGAAGKQLHLYRGEKKVGHLTFDLRRTTSTQESPDYTLHLSGMLEKGALAEKSASISWRVSINLRDAQRWAGAGGRISIPEQGAILNFMWREGSPTPEFTFHAPGKPVVDDTMLQSVLGQLFPGASGGLAPAGAAPDDSMKVLAREGVTKIAGQRRKSYMVEFELSLLDRYRATAVFTEEGDLALIELPNGYRALEPYIHGLIPEEPEETL